jgi:hypothetical protein
MPADCSLRSYYHRGILPGKQSGQQNHRQTGAVIGSPCPCLPFRTKCKLSPEKEILSPQGCAGSKTQRQKWDGIPEHRKQNGQEMVKRSDDIHGHSGCHTITLRAIVQPLIGPGRTTDDFFSEHDP